MTSLLHHVSTHDHPVTNESLTLSMRMVEETRRILSMSSGIYDLPVTDRGVRTVMIRGARHLRIAHDEVPNELSVHPTRRVHLIDPANDQTVVFEVDTCAKPYGSIRSDDHEIGVVEILDMMECALTTAPLTLGRMSARLQTVMDGVAWMRNDPDAEGARLGLPWMWLAPSPVRGMRLNAIEQPWDLHTPSICCLRIRDETDRLRISLSGFAGHTLNRSMNMIDGIRAVRELEEWRAEDLGGARGLAA